MNDVRETFPGRAGDKPPAKKWMKGNIIQIDKMIGGLGNGFLMFFGELQHRSNTGNLGPDGGSRALEATLIWVLQWERGGSQGLCQLAGQGAELSCKPLTVASQASSDCVKLQHGAGLSREGGSRTALPLGQRHLSLHSLGPRVWASETATKIKMGNFLMHWLVF